VRIKDVFIVGVILLIFLLPSLFIRHDGYWWDEVVYLGLAENLQNRVYAINLGQESFRPPFFPFLLFLFYPVGEWFLKLLPLLFGVLSIIASYLLLGKINKELGFLSALFLATNNLFIFFSQRLLAESLFVLITVLILYVLYKSLQENRYLVLLGLLLAVSFLTKYQGLIFVPVAVFCILSTRPSLFKAKELWLGFFVFVLCLVPWLLISIHYYGSVFGTYEAEMQTLSGELVEKYFGGEWYYHITHSIEIFGLSILFIIPFMLKKKFTDFEKQILIGLILVLAFFSFIVQRKELRYLVSFQPLFYIAVSYGLLRLRKNMGVKWWSLLLIVVVVMSLSNVLVATQNLAKDIDAGLGMKKAAELVHGETYVMAENYPVVNYVSKAKAIPFPSFEDFERTLNEYNISYIIVDRIEVTTPDYAYNLSYPLAAHFTDKVNEVWVYMVDKVMAPVETVYLQSSRKTTVP
jgi:4-amino-4-deoxy-L-arabinose transferase-like glycosyltransferase